MGNNIYELNKDTSIQWKDENFDFTNARTTAGTLPDLTLIPGTNIEIASFDGNNTSEGVSITKELNHDYAEGTDLYFHTHWFPTTTASGTVRWNVDYYVSHNEYNGVVTSGLLSILVNAPKIAWQQEFATFPALNLGTLSKIGSQVSFRFYRTPATDSYPDDACVATMGWHYQTNSRGSALISTK